MIRQKFKYLSTRNPKKLIAVNKRLLLCKTILGVNDKGLCLLHQ